MESRKRMVKVLKQETLLLLRAYREHPTRWAEILEEIMQNLQHLPDDARNLYKSSSRKQLRDRLSSKFGKLLTTKQEAIDDVEIRYVSLCCCLNDGIIIFESLALASIWRYIYYIHSDAWDTAAKLRIVVLFPSVAQSIQ